MAFDLILCGMERIAIAAALAVLMSGQTVAGELWCPVAGNEYGFGLEISEAGYVARSTKFEQRCLWTNSEKTAANCDGAPYGVKMKRKGDTLMFDHWEKRFGVTAGPQLFVRC